MMRTTFHKGSKERLQNPFFLLKCHTEYWKGVPDKRVAKSHNYPANQLSKCKNTLIPADFWAQNSIHQLHFKGVLFVDHLGLCQNGRHWQLQKGFYRWIERTRRCAEITRIDSKGLKRVYKTEAREMHKPCSVLAPHWQGKGYRHAKGTNSARLLKKGYSKGLERFVAIVYLYFLSIIAGKP